MTENQKTNSIRKAWPVYAALIFLIAVLGYVIAKQKQAGTTCKPTGHDHTNELVDSKKPVTIADIVEVRRTWDPVITDVYGTKAPDFTVKTIDGNDFTLSDHAGKEVMLVFWATWCGYCVQEIPHLIALNKDLSDSDFAMIAISDEPTSTVKNFLQSRKNINYPIAIEKLGFSDMPSIYQQAVQLGRPAAMYIDKKGNIKLSAIGTQTLTEMKRILKAE